MLFASWFLTVEGIMAGGLDNGIHQMLIDFGVTSHEAHLTQSSRRVNIVGQNPRHDCVGEFWRRRARLLLWRRRARVLQLALLGAFTTGGRRRRHGERVQIRRKGKGIDRRQDVAGTFAFFLVDDDGLVVVSLNQ